jgi:hypothetical protein
MPEMLMLSAPKRSGYLAALLAIELSIASCGGKAPELATNVSGSCTYKSLIFFIPALLGGNGTDGSGDSPTSSGATSGGTTCAMAETGESNTTAATATDHHCESLCQMHVDDYDSYIGLDSCSVIQMKDSCEVRLECRMTTGCT